MSDLAVSSRGKSGVATRKPSFRFERALEKVEEGRFFLTLMKINRKTPQQFGYCLSAFLSAFKSAFERLKTTVGDEHIRRRAANAVRNLRQSRPDVDFLMEARNAEVHREGVKIELEWQTPSVTPERWWSRFNPPWARSESRFNPRWGRAEGHPVAVWKFSDRRTADVITLCKNSLNALEDLIQNMAGEASPASRADIPC